MTGMGWDPDLGSGRLEPTGVRISRARKRRGWTQTGLAARANISRSLIAQVESGHKPATPSLVATVARVCGVDAAEINGQPYRGSDKRTDAVHAAMPAIRRALAYADIAPDLEIPPRSLEMLAVEMAALQKLQGSAAHVAVGSRLPAAIEELTIHALELGVPEAWRLLHHSYALVVSLARRLGYNDLAHVAIERGAAAALRANDPHLQHLVSLSRATLLLTLGSGDIALTLANRVVSNVDQSTPTGLEVYGSLHLRAAVSAARLGRKSEAWDHHGHAADTAERIAPRDRLDPHGLQLNPANVAIHGCALATELGDYDTAIRLDADFKLPTSLYGERRAHHEIDMARAHLWLNEHDKSLKRVLRAERIAPQMTRFHPTARETVRQLGPCYRSIPEKLRALEARMAL